jgi:hypothetical protein
MTDLPYFDDETVLVCSQSVVNQRQRAGGDSATMAWRTFSALFIGTTWTPASTVLRM